MKPGGKTWSLFRYQVIFFGASYFLLLTAALVLLYALLARGLESEKMAMLTDREDAVIALLKSPAHGLEELYRRVRQEWPARNGRKIFVRVEGDSHQVLTQSPGIPAEIAQLLAGLSENVDGRRDSAASCRRFSLPGLEYFGCYREEENVSAVAGRIQVYAITSDEESSGFLTLFREIAFLVLFLSILASAAIGWLMARRGMGPIRAIALDAGRFGSHNLDERIGLDELPIELHGLAESFNQSLDRIEESFRRLARFSDDIAHELRTPINNMMGELEVALGRTRSAEEYAEILASNLEECSRLVQLVESMLFLARAENLDYHVRAEPIQVAAELGKLREFFEPAASEKSIRITVVDSGAAGMAVMAEPNLFQRAIGNLLANAIHYSREGGEVQLAFALLPAGRGVEIRVSDNGVGIAPEHLGKIFERFYRVDFSRSLHLGGFGLGLAIVKGIMELHAGKVSVESVLGEGTTFHTEWKLAQPGPDEWC